MESEQLESGTIRVPLTSRQKKNLSEDAQALIEAGYYTADLELVSRKHFIKHLLLPKFEAEYAQLARMELAALDEEKVAASVPSKKRVK